MGQANGSFALSGHLPVASTTQYLTNPYRPADSPPNTPIRARMHKPQVISALLRLAIYFPPPKR
jgi:hypothetical protein